MNSIDESIYHLIPSLVKSSECSEKRKNSQYYRSIFSDKIINAATKTKFSHRTMGPAIIARPDPHHPLRSHQNSIHLPNVLPFIRPHRMPPIPKALQATVDHEKPNRNFVKENIAKMRSTLPTCPRRFVVSDRRGNKFLIDGSGLQKDFIFKKEYGKIPSYLKRRLIVGEPIENKSESDEMMMLSVEERLHLIQSLKLRYETVFAEYQRLPLRPETTSTLIKQTYLTEELVQLDRDIEFLEKYKQIFVVQQCDNTET